MQCSQCFKCVHRDCDPDGIEDNYLCVECVKSENQAMTEDVEMEDMMNNEVWILIFLWNLINFAFVWDKSADLLSINKIKFSET